MPDPNKFLKLRESGYRIPLSCDLCTHSAFPQVLSNWGTCDLYAYNPQQHTGIPRGMSINRLGTCPRGMFSPRKIEAHGFEAHTEFLEMTNEKSSDPT